MNPTAEDAFRHHRLWPQRRFPGQIPWFFTIYISCLWCLHMDLSSIFFLKKMENTGIVIVCVLRGRSRKQWTSCKRFYEGEVHLKLSKHVFFCLRTSKTSHGTIQCNAVTVNLTGHFSCRKFICKNGSPNVGECFEGNMLYLVYIQYIYFFTIL